MVQYNSSPQRFIETSFGKIASFISHESFVNDEKTIQSFAEEWNKFGFFSDVEITTAGLEYFDIINDVVLNRDSVILDIGCGSGRWSKYLSGRVKFIEAMDAGNAVFAAQQFLHNNRKIRVTQAPAINIPFPDNSFDFIMSLGVFHHMHDTQNALNHSVTKIKPGGYYLLYLYYNFDNRPFIYKFLFFFADVFRKIISKLPFAIKSFCCECIAIFIYYPFIFFLRIIQRMFPSVRFWTKLPLSYYANKSFRIIRNDALDRFGTPVEKRFSQTEIKKMMEDAGLGEIIFSHNPPYWHAIGKRIK